MVQAKHIMPEHCFASLRLLSKPQGDAVFMGTSECLNGAADAVVFGQVCSLQSTVAWHDEFSAIV